MSKMKIHSKAVKVFVVLVTAFIVLVFSTCIIEGKGTSFERITYNLQGTWECIDEAPWPAGQTEKYTKGKLIMAYKTITITGPITSLQGYTRGIVLEAYTDNNMLYIKDKGVWQSPIAYNYWTAANPNIKLLTFGSSETLRRIGE